MPDTGCGFGLFALYHAATHRPLQFHGLDINRSRIAMARLSARRLGRTNATFTVGDAAGEPPFHGVYQGASMLDLVQHIPVRSVRPLLERLHDLVVPGGRVVIKDMDTRPSYKRAFTYFLGRLMDQSGEIHSWPSKTLRQLLSEVGFEVY